MPRGDGSGPNGMGPMTGRGAGTCAGAATPGFANPRGGFGCGRGRGQFGGRNAFGGGAQMRGRFAGVSQASGLPVDDKEFLSNQAKLLQERLDEINKHLAEL